MPLPNALTAQQMNDLIQTTLRDLGRDRFTELSTSLQRHTAMRNLLKKNRVTLQSGTGIQWDVMVAHAASASNVGMASSDNVNFTDTMVQATADWRNSTCNYPIEGREISMNREPSRIVELIRTRRLSALIALAELMEANFWGPPVGLTDTLTPWGVNTWIVKSATQGFNGTVPSGYTSIGLNPTTYPRWANYTDQYTNVTYEDFVRKARRMAQFTDWQPPVEGIPTFHTGDDYGLYSNYGLIGPVEELLMSQNDNLGDDLGPKDGRSMLRRTPIQWVPYLEADTTNPLYLLNWGSFKTFILQDWWLRETHVPIYPGQHTVQANFIDSTYQFVTKNRRCHGVMATGTTYPS